MCITVGPEVPSGIISKQKCPNIAAMNILGLFGGGIAKELTSSGVTVVEKTQLVEQFLCQEGCSTTW